MQLVRGSGEVKLLLIERIHQLMSLGIVVTRLIVIAHRLLEAINLRVLRTNLNVSYRVIDGRWRIEVTGRSSRKNMSYLVGFVRLVLFVA